MSEMLTRIAKRITETLRHHGVVMHPDDIRGLAEDALWEMRTPTPEMMKHIMLRKDTDENGMMDWKAAIDVALKRQP
mgnify:FL=1